ncbi:MAG: hypothetical protein ACP5I1_08350 [Candidatus Hinthialibacter sp.]
MMKNIMWILGIILLSPFYGASQQIRFEAVRQNVILNIDQQNFVDLVVHHDKAFLLASRWNAHSFYSGRSFVMIDLAKAPENENEYYSAIPEGYYSLFGLTYQSDMYYLPEEEKLQDRIVPINDALHLPDRSDCSHHFTLTGDYLGKFPDFFNLENQYQDVKIKGEPIQFPADEPALDRRTIQTFGLMISEKQAGPFRLVIEWIKAGCAPEREGKGSSS